VIVQANTASASMINGGCASSGRHKDLATLKSLTTTEQEYPMSIKNGMRPVHPGGQVQHDLWVDGWLTGVV
jgi:hypothetical protein